MQTSLHVTLKDVYGNVKAYPACEQSQRLAELLNTKTLTPHALSGARAMGFELVYVDRFGTKSSNAETTKMLLSLR